MATRTQSMETDPITGQKAEGRSTIETKEFFRSSEFWVLLLTVFGVCMVCLQNSVFDAPAAIRLITALSIAYIVSRGIAKAGSAHIFWGRDVNFGFKNRGHNDGHNGESVEARLARLEAQNRVQ